ncbi:MAG TPA: hypothetical protein VK194_09280 [Candidatus Deferrimicrobium sp.]|nr:hypothetical protein [Candidatus Deferrimicrobium sp.]
MRINRRLLYWGIFLVAIGGVLVAADVGRADSGSIANGLRLWPVALVAIGVGIVARRTRFSLPGGMLAAALPGLLIGGSFAIVPRIAADCGSNGAVATVAAHDGVFDGPARVAVTTGCGAIDVTTAPGGAWHFDDGITSNRAALVEATSRSLSIDSGRTDGLTFDGIGRDEWHLTLPTAPIDDLSFVVNAGRGRIGLPGAKVGRLAVTSNAAETTVDLSETALTSLAADVNAGRVTFRLASTADIVGSMDVNLADLEVCAPSELGVRIHHTGALSGFAVDGRQQPGADWQSPNYTSAAHRADLTVDVHLGNVAINPIGGCK